MTDIASRRGAGIGALGTRAGVWAKDDIGDTPRLGVGGIMMLRLTALLMLAAIPQAVAQELGDIARGRVLAETWCATCHTLAPTGERAAGGRAPSLRAIADSSATTPLSLRVFLQTPHDRMPNLKLGQGETDDLIRYILSLRQH